MTTVSHVVAHHPERAVLLSVSEYLAMPRAARIHCVLSGLIDFFDDNGGCLALSEALPGLRESWLPVAPRGDDSGVFPRACADEERRAHPRRPTIRPVRIVRLETGSEHLALCRDFSNGGMQLRSRRLYRVGERLRIEFVDSFGRRAGCSSSEVTVARSWTPHPDGAAVFPHGAGVSFDRAQPDLAVGLDAADQEAVG